MIVIDSVRAYLDDARPDPDVLLAEMEAHGARDGVPILDPHSAALLHVLARGMGARRIVEVGTAIGVSTLSLARALPDDGELVSFELDRARHAAASSYLSRARLRARVDLRLEDARQGLPRLDGEFDLAFLDGVKAEYLELVELTVPLLRPGGIVAIDNALVDSAGDAVDGAWSVDRAVAGRQLNDTLLRHPDLVTTIIPVGDGIALAARR